jgi:gas vesicle protein
MKDSAKTILLLLTGVAAGVAVGMLLAPDKGVETRKKLMKSGRSMAENLRNRIDRLKLRGKESHNDEEFLANGHSEHTSLGTA